MAMARIELCSVNKKYGNTVAVSDFSLVIQDREFVVLVGPSGCGKSTTLRIVAGLEKPTGGAVIIDDQIVTGLAPKDRDIAMVFQNYALYPHMNVYDNMAFGLKMRKVAKEQIDRRVREAADTLEITDLLERKPRQLSGGQQQRVALGRAIVRNAKVFLMDEPLSNLDAKLRIQMRAEIIKLHKKLEATVIYVTHDQIEAMTMGDRIVVMKDGQIQQSGTPEEIYDRPANLFVAGFMGVPPMNFLNWRAGVVLGIRPENISLTEKGGGEVCFKVAEWRGISDYKLIGKAELIENTGSEKIVHLQTTYGQTVAKIGHSQPVEVGKDYFLHFSSSNAHFFDEKSGIRLE